MNANILVGKPQLQLAGLSSLRLPSAGTRLDLPELPGSADALALAQLASDPGCQTPLVVICASPNEAQRLLDEIPWFAPHLQVRSFPDWETLPYDHFSPHQDLVSERLSTLWAIQHRQCDLLLVPASTALYRLAPPSFLGAYTFFFRTKDKLDLSSFRTQLSLAGYSHVTQVAAPGEFAIRGGIIDLFAMGTDTPYRLDLFDDEIESIHCFDIDSQRSREKVDTIKLLPAHEFPVDDKARAGFRQRFREAFEGDPSQQGIYRDISHGLLPAGIEYYLPLFFDRLATLFDYLPSASILVFHGDIATAIQAFWKDCDSRYRLLQHDKGRPLLPPETLFLKEDEFFTLGKPRARIRLNSEHCSTASLASLLPPLAVNRRSENPIASLKSFADQFEGRILVLAESPGRRETLTQLFAEYDFRPPLANHLAGFLHSRDRQGLAVSPLQHGFIAAIEGHGAIALVTESELYADIPRRTRHEIQRDQRRRASVDHWLKDLTELKIGDPVVHEQHGVGRYQGLLHLDLGDGDVELLELHYADDAKLYVPVSQFHVISRYSGREPDAAPLHTLGSGQWEKAKRKAAEQAHDTAAELLALYAARSARQGYAFQFDHRDYEAFADGFAFEETPDQASAIAAVIDDMTQGKPMDRLVCGDVGFGKTEVALRAAFCAVSGGRQAAILCPTTLLCEQHFQTFSDRLADWPIRIAEISRFRSAKEIAQTLADLAAGKIDIIIGTHRLIQKDIKFARLGLVIIDEEHRFGVRQKETLKALRAEVDVLTLTATPIPRTLAMSLEGLRDFSVIATAPQKRLAIKTFVHRASDGIIREAILRELKRGGQVYFLHNQVNTIGIMQQRLSKLVPEARIVIGHGQLHERDLEHVMRDFTQQRANVLLCTTIIETGIDNPHANTIIINRAEKFGLAQLHQLRGRVGRSHHQAYAYLLVEDEKAITKQARQRLEAIQSMEDLGSGFFLAMQDLEIRGAGEVLGDEQSGEMQEVGFNLYAEMLQRAVAALKQGKEPDLMQPLGVATEINLHLPALLPDHYCPDVHQRLILYKRLSNCTDEDMLIELREELVDRFGELPPQTQCLLETHRIRILAQPLVIDKVDAGREQITLHFGRQTPVEPLTIIELIQKRRDIKLAGQDKLALSKHCPGLAERVEAVRHLFDLLAKPRHE